MSSVSNTGLVVCGVALSVVPIWFESPVGKPITPRFSEFISVANWYWYPKDLVTHLLAPQATLR